MNKKELVLNRTRNIGDVISDGFVMIKRTFNVIGQLFLILVLPLLLLGIYNIYYLFKNIDFLNVEQSSPFGMHNIVSLLGGYGFTIFAISIYYFIIYATTICYRNNGNQTPEREEVVTFMKDNAIRFLIYFLAVLGFMIAAFAVGAATVLISPIITVLIFLGFFVFIIYLFPILSILPMVYLDSNLSFVDAVKESFRLIKNEWWSTFGVIVITQIIGSMASYVLIIPVYVIMMVQMMSGMDDPSSQSTDSMGFWMAILMIVSLIAGTIVLIYTVLSVGLKYYDLRERKDNTHLMDRIDEIGEQGPSLFENEGDF